MRFKVDAGQGHRDATRWRARPDRVLHSPSRWNLSANVRSGWRRWCPAAGRFCLQQAAGNGIGSESGG